MIQDNCCLTPPQPGNQTKHTTMSQLPDDQKAGGTGTIATDKTSNTKASDESKDNDIPRAQVGVPADQIRFLTDMNKYAQELQQIVDQSLQFEESGTDNSNKNGSNDNDNKEENLLIFLLLIQILTEV